MKSLTKTQFNALIFGLLATPFAYLAYAFPNSSEAKVSNHTGLFITIAGVLFTFFISYLAYYFDALKPEKEKYLGNARIMMLVAACLSAVYGFIFFPKMLEFQASKGEGVGHSLTIWLSMAFIFIGNYQYRLKPGSAFSGILTRSFSENTQNKINRTQGVCMMVAGLFGTIYTLYVKTNTETFSIVMLAMALAPILGLVYAIFSTSKKDRNQMDLTKENKIGAFGLSKNEITIRVALVGMASIWIIYKLIKGDSPMMPAFSMGFFGGLACLIAFYYFVKKK